jgi:hypothetical protein
VKKAWELLTYILKDPPTGDFAEIPVWYEEFRKPLEGKGYKIKKSPFNSEKMIVVWSK